MLPEKWSYQSVKARTYDSFNHSLATKQDRRRSKVFAELFDVGFLRHRWTNFGQIAPDVYRSNHPGPARLGTYAAQGIKTVLNLRNDAHKSTTQFEIEACEELGLTYVNFPMAPRRAPYASELAGLVDLFGTLEKPILMHCKSGADRTGIAGVIWRLTQEGEPIAQAKKELSIRYLHRRNSETGVLDIVIDMFEESGMDDFRAWAENHYDETEATARFNDEAAKHGFVDSMRQLPSQLYRLGQMRKAEWHKSFKHEIRNDQDRKRARFFINWVDHGILRVLWHNHQEIAPGVFRSNHPTEDRLRNYKAEGLKTVVNLRGASLQPHYQLEKGLCQTLDLTLIDIPMNATRAPSREIFEQLFDVFDTAERPMMFHCKSGADRTGIVSAAYLLYQGGLIADAREQLSLRFVHLRNSNKGVLDEVLEAYSAANYLEPIGFRDWIRTAYDPAAVDAAFKVRRAKA